MQTKNLLVVDDSKMARKIIAVSLRNEKHIKVYEASSGLEALEQLLGTPVDLIFTDINMPNMDGLEFIRRCKENEQLKDIPIIVLTTEDGIEDRDRALSLGATGYVTKPLEREDIVKIINATLPDA